MTLENKYNVPRETLKKMCEDGVLSGTVMRHYEVYDIFKKLKSESPSRSNHDIFCQMANELKLAVKTIEKIVYYLPTKW